ncbi:transposase-like zinc-binding domain-containing protein, partial [Brevibacterium sp. FAM 24630]|uniref:transposase-like zinc-binding domain-containing protein n=1 Tax=Brevibacterium sp. FAM 24630 TaxID=3415680 RepID=UPI003C7C0A15
VCGVCANKLVKNGKTGAGRTRWRCKHCGCSAIQTRTDSAKKADFTSFIAWLTSTQPRGDFATSTRTFTRKIQWCWNVTPRVVLTGEIHDQIMLDGTYFNGWCVLIAYTGT